MHLLKCNSSCLLLNCSLFSSGKQAEAHFAVVHYAGTVRYNANNFLVKNKDPLNDSAVSVLKTSQGNEIMLNIWSDYVTQEEAAEMAKQGVAQTKKKGKSASFMTVSMIYRESLTNLMTMLYQTHPHFIRCIIPNEKKASGVIGIFRTFQFQGYYARCESSNL